MKHLLSLLDYKPKEIREILDLAIDIKKKPEKYSNALKQKTLAMIFQKTSTRTRLSFEAGMTRLGGHAIFLDWQTTQLKKARLRDEIRAIERYADLIMARVFAQADLETMAEAVSRTPIINGLSDDFHPCQALADYLTLEEQKGKLKGLVLAYVGDGNNVCNSLITCGSRLGVQVKVATPKGFEPLKKVIEASKDYLEVELYNNPIEAVKDADAVYTDTWISMGQEHEKEKRLKAFQGYTVTRELMMKANNAIFLHCLPAFIGFEVTEEVIESPYSKVFEQAENRMHTQNALMIKLMEWNKLK